MRASLSARLSIGSRWLAGAASILILAIAFAYAFYTIFSRSLSLDEGYVMITVRGFLEGQPLYDSVFTQYGPFFYFYQWIARNLLAIPLTHDATRFLCIFHWLSASMVLALAGRIMTRSILGGLFVFMQAVVHIAPVANEPGHPQELVALFLALAILMTNRDVHKNGTLEGLALLGAALLFTKTNVGIFFGLALLLSMRWHSTDRLAGLWAWALIAGCAVLPFLLMRRHIMQEWCRNYALLLATTLIATLMTAREITAQRPARARDYLSVGVVLLAAAVVFTAGTLLTGTSLRGLIDGLVRKPLLTPEIALWPLRVSNFALLSAAASLVLAVFVWVNTNHPRRPFIVTALKALFGIAGSILFVGDAHAQLKYLLPWVWLTVVPGLNDRQSGASFPRVFLCLMAAWQGLQGYPIAGTQVAIGTLPLVLACTVCLADALNAISLPERIRQRFGVLPSRTIVVCQILGIAALVCFFAIAWCKLPDAHNYYLSLPRLDLPGSRFVRTDANTTQLYQSVARYLRANCDTFVTSPGIHSFYFWTGKRPPTYLNSTSVSLLSTRQEEQVLAGLNRVRRPLIVINDDIYRRWGQDTSVADRPFFRALRNDYVEIHRIPPISFYAPKEHRE